MNANAFCVRNRVFAMRVGTELVLKLPPQRVAAVSVCSAVQLVVRGCWLVHDQKPVIEIVKQADYRASPTAQ
jgi:hypothetical protein